MKSRHICLYVCLTLLLSVVRAVDNVSDNKRKDDTKTANDPMLLLSNERGDSVFSMRTIQEALDLLKIQYLVRQQNYANSDDSTPLRNNISRRYSSIRKTGPAVIRTSIPGNHGTDFDRHKVQNKVLISSRNEYSPTNFIPEYISSENRKPKKQDPNLRIVQGDSNGPDYVGEHRTWGVWSVKQNQIPEYNIGDLSSTNDETILFQDITPETDRKIYQRPNDKKENTLSQQSVVDRALGGKRYWFPFGRYSPKCERARILRNWTNARKSVPRLNVPRTRQKQFWQYHRRLPQYQHVQLGKRYGRPCYTNSMTLRSLIEYLSTGRICGRRVTLVRFGLGGK